MAERVFNLPDLSEGLEDAEIVEWKVAEGDAVELNQPLVDVNTAKALVEIPSPYAGTIVRLHGGDGDVIDVGAPLVTFEVEGGDAEPEAPKREAVLVGYGVDTAGKAKRRRRLRPPSERGASARPKPAGDGKAAAAPPVRRLAKELGVDLAGLVGTGPGGRITREDVQKVAASGETAPVVEAQVASAAAGEGERIPVRGVRRLIAQKMSRAWAEVPHVTTFHMADATHVDALRKELTEHSGTKVTALPVIARALVEVCREHPKLNSSWDEAAGEILLKREYHVGIATDTEEGLIVTVVRDTGEKGIITLAKEIVDLVETARARRATPEQLTGSTITITNVGTFGSEFGTPIVNFPEAAILAVGAIKPRALVLEGSIEARLAVTLSLSFDHRIIDGAEADRAMSALRELLESPERLAALPRE
ncbi:MAG: dihydrolipoamide acetyltransferase family protein [Actinomycetota bacterium]